MEIQRYIPTRELGIKVAEGATRVIVAFAAVQAGENILNGQKVVYAESHTETYTPEFKRANQIVDEVLTKSDHVSRNLLEGIEPTISIAWDKLENLDTRHPDSSKLAKILLVGAAVYYLRRPRTFIWNTVTWPFRLLMGVAHPWP